MCSFVHTAMIDGGRADRRASRAESSVDGTVDLDDANRYQHFNPVIGATYKFIPNLTAYAGYSEANRAPTPLAPWRIVELPNGFAIEDATGKQTEVFYGLAPDIAGPTSIMTMDEARQTALDFARLPELLQQHGG
jgi:hypothetical protein